MKYLILILANIIIFFPTHLLAISETDYENQYELKITPYRDNNFLRESFLSFDGKTNLNFYQPRNKNNKRAILILPGRMEPAIKYFELVYDLKDSKADFYILDHRGQGFSDRLLDDIMKGHVQKFSDYISDLNKFFSENLKSYPRVDIISHSMGGAIHLSFLQAYPEIQSNIKKNISIAPMVDINFAPYKKWQAVGLLRFLDIINQDHSYVPGGKPFNPNATFEENRVTNSEPRWKRNHSFYIDYPELQSGSTTVRWTLESHLATDRLIKKRNLLKDIDFLYFQANDDSFVTNKRNKKLCDSIQKCQLVIFPKSKHAIHSEKDEIRNKMLQKLKEFLNSH